MNESIFFIEKIILIEELRIGNLCAEAISYFANFTFTGYEIASAPAVIINYKAIPGASQWRKLSASQ
ncbi:MAG TPA: hypothetical protein VIQ23_18005 [Hanamia sp.]